MLWSKAVDHNNYKAVLRACQAPSDIRSSTPCRCVATISLRLSIVNSVDNAVSFSILTIHLTPAVEFPHRIACSLQFTYHEQIVAHSDVSTAVGNLCQIIRHCFSLFLFQFIFLLIFFYKNVRLHSAAYIWSVFMRLALFESRFSTSSLFILYFIFRFNVCSAPTLFHIQHI